MSPPASLIVAQHGALPFDGLTSWLPEYYNACAVLLKTMNVSMEKIFGKEVASSAVTLIQAFKDDAAKIVNKTIAAHTKSWAAKKLKERKALAQSADFFHPDQMGTELNARLATARG